MRCATIVVVGVLAFAACDRRGAIETCDDRLDGVYVVDGARWVVVDHRLAGKPRTIEAYPLFADVPATASPGAPGRAAPDSGAESIDGLEVAPRVLDFGADLSGVVRRRYMRGATACTGKVPARITKCGREGLEIVRTDPAPPTSFSPCAFGRTEPSRREKWARE